MQNYSAGAADGRFFGPAGHGIRLAAIQLIIIFVGYETNQASVLKKSETGRRGEDLALDWLLARGLRLRDRNWRGGHKELDLVMESADRLHVVEVKTLTPPLQHQPYENVDAAKQSRLVAAARQYVAEQQVRKEVQFDVVSVVLDGGQTTVDYIPEAFYPIRSKY